MEDTNTLSKSIISKEIILPIAALLAAVIFWGSSFAGTRYAIITGWIMLGEGLNSRQCLAAVVVIIGVLLSQKKSV